MNATRLQLATVWGSLAAVAIGVGGVAFLGWVVPEDAVSGWCIFNQASPHFRSAVPGADRLPVISVDAFHLWFRVSVVSAWGGYAGLLVALSRLGQAPRGALAAVAALTAIALAAPLYLSSDVYSYTADGRLYWVHGLNPMSATPSVLTRQDDPIREFTDRDVVHPYGPAWTVIELAVVGGTLWTGLVGQLMGFKLLAGAALLAAAFAARAITRRTPAARHADLAFVAVAAHPMLLIEGPGMGHNDIVMMACFSGAVLAWLAGRPVLAGLGLGLAAAVKLLPLAAVTWVVIAAWRAGGARQALLTAAVAVLPLLLLYAAFAQGSRLGDALTRGSTVTASPEVKRANAELRARLTDAGVPDSLAAALTAAWRKRVLVGVYLVATLYAIAIRRPDSWAEAWVPFAAVLAVFATGRALPWYPTWALVPAACGSCRFAVPAVALVTGWTFVLTWRYTVLW